MSTCARIVHGAAARMRGRAANDNSPIHAFMRSLVLESRVGMPSAGVVAAFTMDRELYRLDRSHKRPRLQSHDSEYDNLLGLVGAEMAQP